MTDIKTKHKNKNENENENIILFESNEISNILINFAKKILSTNNYTIFLEAIIKINNYSLFKPKLIKLAKILSHNYICIIFNKFKKLIDLHMSNLELLGEEHDLFYYLIFFYKLNMDNNIDSIFMYEYNLFLYEPKTQQNYIEIEYIILFENLFLQLLCIKTSINKYIELFDFIYTNIISKVLILKFYFIEVLISYFYYKSINLDNLLICLKRLYYIGAFAEYNYGYYYGLCMINCVYNLSFLIKIKNEPDIFYYFINILQKNKIILNKYIIEAKSNETRIFLNKYGFRNIEYYISFSSLYIEDRNKVYLQIIDYLKDIIIMNSINNNNINRFAWLNAVYRAYKYV